MTSLRTIGKRLGGDTLTHYPRKYYYAYRQARKFQKADVVVVSFPKAGRTWLRVLLGKILCDKYSKDFTIELEELKDQGAPGIYMTHDEAQNYGRPIDTDKRKYRNKKVIFLVRDPRDVVVSYYFQLTKRQQTVSNLDMAAFIRNPRYGIDRVIDLMNIWADNQHVPSGFMIVKYEDLRNDTAGELARVLRFIGISDVSEELINDAVAFGSFENMRQMEQSNSLENARLKSKDTSDPEAFKVRRGKVGGYVDYLSEDDIAFMNGQINDRLVREFGYS